MQCAIITILHQLFFCYTIFWFFLSSYSSLLLFILLLLFFSSLLFVVVYVLLQCRNTVLLLYILYFVVFFIVFFCSFCCGVLKGCSGGWDNCDNKKHYYKYNTIDDNIENESAYVY